MRIGGLTKCSLIDYPGKVSGVIFTQGCNFRCPWCHNPELVYPDQFRTSLEPGDIFYFLTKRLKRLDGVVITGGEPTWQPDLIEFISRIKSLGFAIKLDTNGSHPELLATLLGNHLINFVAMDIKAPFDKYNLVTGVKVAIDNIKSSIHLIESSGIDYQFRTTFCDMYLNQADLAEIRSYVADVTRYKVQAWVAVKGK